MMFIGDKSHSVNSTLDPADTSLYRCVCGKEKHVFEEYDYLQDMFFPKPWEEAICECGNSMDRVEKIALGMGDINEQL